MLSIKSVTVGWDNMAKEGVPVFIQYTGVAQQKLF